MLSFLSFGIKSIKRCDVNSVGLIAPICRNKILFKDVSYFIKVSNIFRENSRHINSEDTKNIYFKYLLSNLFLRKP